MDFKFDVCGFEHTHLHTTIGSLLDGYGKPEEYAQRAKKNNQQFLCVSDHGSMAAIPQQIKAANEYGLNFIAACELYVNDHQPSFKHAEDYKHFVENCSPDDKLKLKKSYHILAIAFSNKGYSNLVKLSTLAWSSGVGGLPRRPRLTHKQLQECKEGIIFTSCCCLSEIAVAFDTGGEEAGEQMILKYLKMFGENFYLELMLLDFKKQKPYDAFLIKMHAKHHIPLTISNDVHYCEKEDSKYQTYMLLTRGKKKISDLEQSNSVDPDGEHFELYDKNLYMKSEIELDEKWLSDYRDAIPYELYCNAKRNTVKICEKAKGVVLDRSIKLPKIPDADAKLKEAVMRGFKWRGLPTNERYISQLRKEYDLIVHKDFSSYFLINKMMTDEARRICPEIIGWGTGEEALGPGRGSAVSFLTCYCLGITDVNPVYHNLIPERFLSEARGGKQMKLPFSKEPTEKGLVLRGSKYL